MQHFIDGFLAQDSVEARDIERASLVALRLPEPLRSHAWAIIVERFEAAEPDARSGHLGLLVRAVPDTYLTQVGSWTLLGRDRVTLCRRLCDGGRIRDALEAARASEGEDRARALAVVAGHERVPALDEALEAIEALDDPGAAIDAVAPLLDADATVWLTELLASREGDDREAQLLARAALADTLPAPMARAIADEAFDSVTAAPSLVHTLAVAVCAEGRSRDGRWRP